MLRLAWRNLARRRLRSLLTCLGVAIGISVVVALQGLSAGGEGQINRAMAQHRGDIVVTAKGARIVGRMTAADLAAVRAVDGVARSFPYTVLSGVEVTTAARPADAEPLRLIVLAFPDPEWVAKTFPLQPAGAAAPSGGDQVALGARAAGELGVAVGGTVSIRDRVLRITALYETGIAFQDRGVVMPLATARELFNLGAAANLALADVAPGTTPGEVAARINAAVPRVHAVAAAEVVDSWEERKVLQGILWAISCIAFLAGGIGVMNTMTMSVLERTREIGLLLAVGWRGRQVRRLILAEGVLVSLAGGVAGWFLGIGWVVLAEWLAPSLTIQGAFGAGLFGVALAVALGMGLAGGLIPAWTASRLDPMEALRHE